MNKTFQLTVVVFVLIVASIFLLTDRFELVTENSDVGTSTNLVTLNTGTSTSTRTNISTSTFSQIEPITVIAENLEIPWDIAFLPSGDLLVTERPGRLVRIASDGVRTNIPLTGVTHTAEGGLLGIVLHPDFSSNSFVYLYMSSPGQNGQTQNRVVRYVLAGNSLQDEKVIIDGIPGAIYHDGGRMEFGPDKLLYITTGDATKSDLAQDLGSLAGKILRLHDDGSIPTDNPFGTAVYSYGHRNPQGLAWDVAGNLWSTEHGRSGVTSGYDEVNLIEKGKNYGWPVIEGPETRAEMVTPTLQSGTSDTWAPASASIINGVLYFGGLRGESLYEVWVGSDGTVSDLKRHFSKEFGRIRTTRVGPDGMLYITTSNRDGRGSVKTGDDKIIRINPSSL